MRLMMSLCMLLAPSLGLAGDVLERVAEHQRAARIGFIVGASAPVFMLAATAMNPEASVGVRAGVASVGVAGSAVGLSLLGRRSMKAGVLLDLSGGGGAVTLFFDIVTVAVGTHYVLIGQNPSSAAAYLIGSGGALAAGGLQLRRNQYTTEMRTDPRVYVTPTGAGITGRF
ncbi:MAG: hypothetical protein ACI8RZ_001146 [Myxococcota bacterium]|jgi:hypothetical protein